MKHKVLILTWCIFSLLSPQRTALSAQTEPAESIFLAVQDLEPIGVDENLARSVTEILRAELARSKRLRLLEETRRLYRMQLQSVRFRDLVAEGSMRKLGELLESRRVLTGSVSRLDSLLVISARVVDAQTGEILASELVEHRGGVSTIARAVRDLARKVLAHFPITGQVTEIRGDTLVTDLGLSDGLLPGQELMAADLAPAEKERPEWTRSLSRSARYRVVSADDNQSRLLPLEPAKNLSFRVGSTVLATSEVSGEIQSTQSKKTDSALRSMSGAFGSVRIESQPTGALVYLDNLDLGETPVQASQLSAGRHPVILSLPGHTTIIDSVTVKPDSLKTYTFELSQQTGRLTLVTGQPGITVRIDTLEFTVDGSGTIVLEDFPGGAHNLRASKPGFKPLVSTLDIDLDRDSVLEISLEPYPGSLLVKSRPSGAGIYIDGVFTGKTTPTRIAGLAAGSHVLRLSQENYGAAVDTLQVEPGEDLTADLDLVRGWFGYFPEGMVLVPAGTLVFPEGDSVRVDSFYIDLYEVTNRQYDLFVAATGYRPPALWQGDSCPSGKLDHPVASVSYEDAARFASWAGKRLPTEPEWERAAMGDRWKKYPWGDSYQPGRSNTWDAGLGDTSPVGSFPGDRSAFGLYDMVGNVSEWVDGWTGGSPGEVHPYRVFRGGSYYVNQTDPSLASRDGLYPVSKNKYLGFRCARDVNVRR